MRDLYEVLGVHPLDDAEAIRAAYHRLARKLDPRCNPSPLARELLAEATFAFEVLTDRHARALYDEFGVACFQPGFTAGGRSFPRRAGPRADPSFERIRGEGLEDVLRSMRGPGPRARRPAKGRNQILELAVDFMDTVLGGAAEVSVPRASGPPERVEVSIPAGAREGGRICVLGRGHPGMDGPPGDLMLTLRVRPHPLLRRAGNELEMEVPITVLEALQGGVITVPTPIGPAKVTIPAGVPPNGRVVVIGHGIQRRPHPGNLHLLLRPTVPDQVAHEDLLAAQRMEGRYAQPVRARLRL